MSGTLLILNLSSSQYPMCVEVDPLIVNSECDRLPSLGGLRSTRAFGSCHVSGGLSNSV